MSAVIDGGSFSNFCCFGHGFDKFRAMLLTEHDDKHNVMAEESNLKIQGYISIQMLMNKSNLLI